MASSSFPLAFDALCLAAAVDELQPWTGGRLQRIITVDQWSLVLGLYHGREAWVHISLHPRHARAHLCSRRPSAPGEITPFVQTLRQKLTDSRVAFIRQRGLDRVVDIGLQTSSGAWQLVAELTGRHAALILVDEEAKVAAADKYVGAAQSRRPVLPGRPYLPPPFEPRPSLDEAGPDDDWRDFEGCSPTLLKLCQGWMEPGEALERIRSRQWTPSWSAEMGAYPLPFSGSEPRPLFGLIAEAWHSQREKSEALKEAKTGLQKQVERVLLARQTARAELAQASEAADRAREIQSQADLILAYQGMIKPGDEALSAWDFEGREAVIPLDPELTALENAQKLFDRARRAKERKDEVREQLQRVSTDALVLESFLDRLARAETVDEVADLKAEAEGRRWLHKSALPSAREERPYEGHSIRELVSPGGWKVLYGTNSTSNDYLTSRVARPNDWWLHVRGGPSAHVVLQTSNRPDKVQKADLEYAALVAVRNSPAKHSGLVSVDYTLKKHVRKPRKSAPGLAVYAMEKTLHVEPASS